MKCRNLFLLMGLAFASAALPWVTGQARAEQQMTVQSPASPQPFRDPANRMLMQRTTDAQRRQAAKRVATKRAAGKGANRNQSSQDKSTMKGGAK